MNSPRTHAILRGLQESTRSRTFEGRFGRMFRSLPSAEFADTVKAIANTSTGLSLESFAKIAAGAKPDQKPEYNHAKVAAFFSQISKGKGPNDVEAKAILKALTEEMVGNTEPVDQPRQAEAILQNLANEMIGQTTRDGSIPAGYTYLGQFIDHDLTFDPVSSLQRDNDPNAMEDFRTPRFDLDCLYGRGPEDHPYLYCTDGLRMRLGRELNDRQKVTGYDVPRPAEPDPFSPSADDSERAIVGDPRNDENVIIAQLHAIFLQFHNRVADELNRKNKTDPHFLEVQQLVRWHYQWVILYDFLPRIIDPKTYDDLLPHVQRTSGEKPPLVPKSDATKDPPKYGLYEPENAAYIPVEFSGAAYRFGHSMVRESYRLNTNKDPGIGGPFSILGDDPKDASMDLRGFRSFRQDWGIDWDLFFEGGASASDLQVGLKIDTSMAAPLAKLPVSFRKDGPASLAELNLLRGWRLGLPSGQAVAEAIGATPLTDPELKLAGPTGVSNAFHRNAPLWYYILKEAELSAGDTLGPVGSRIVMETFVGLLMEDGHSFLRQKPLWTPPSGPQFGMREFINSARGPRTILA